MPAICHAGLSPPESLIALLGILAARTWQFTGRQKSV
jgi:hypothetical protein